MSPLKVITQLLVLYQQAYAYQNLAAPSSLHKGGMKPSSDYGDSDDEPLYAYVYEYEDDNQIWSDCCKLTANNQALHVQHRILSVIGVGR